MTQKPLHRIKYWTCKQSSESEGYGEYAPLKPWFGILLIEPRPGGNCLEVHRFNQETDEIDYDSNATAIVRPEDLFGTEQEALAHYRKQCAMYADSLLEKASYYYHEAAGNPLNG